nr:MerR family transcriptional regulator [Kibdelosporangium sp. MJ126-NF4]
MVDVSPDRLISTGEAAKQLGIGRTTLHSWWVNGLVEPEYVTPGGHARWDLQDLRRQIKELRKPEDG